MTPQSFGFGRGVTGAPAGTSPTVVNTTDGLRSAVQKSGSLITIAAGEYDFKTDGNKQQVLEITGTNITIKPRPNARVVLKNVRMHVHVDTIDNILIRGLVFRSDGADDRTRDAISLKPTLKVTSHSTSTNKARVWITHCTFDGYFDIAIDSRSATTLPRLLATIDSCLFFDSTPGQPTDLIEGVPAFVNRGAINIGSLDGSGGPNTPQLLSGSHVTIAANVFVDVWRRCPRIANGNFGHVFNNLVYHWGIGNDENNKANKTNSWLCVGVGHGDGTVDGGNNGSALIEANRFIPYAKKMELDKTIDIGPKTRVDIGTTVRTASGKAAPSSALPNRFDEPNGKKRTVAFPAPAGGFVDLTQDPFTQVGFTRPGVSNAEFLDWAQIVRDSGPSGGRDPNSPEAKARQKLVTVLQGAS
jgi:pectate lyase